LSKDPPLLDPLPTPASRGEEEKGRFVSETFMLGVSNDHESLAAQAPISWINTG